PAPLVDVEHLVGHAIAIERARRHRLGRAHDAHDHVAVVEERDAAGRDVAVRGERERLHEPVAVDTVVGRLEAQVAHGLDVMRLRRRHDVVEEGAAPGEALDPEELLRVQPAVGPPELRVPLLRHLAAADVVHQPDLPRASTGHRPRTSPPRAATNVSNRSTTGHTWFGATATISPRRGAGVPAGIRTMPW